MLGWFPIGRFDTKVMTVPSARFSTLNPLKDVAIFVGQGYPPPMAKDRHGIRKLDENRHREKKHGGDTFSAPFRSSSTNFSDNSFENISTSTRCFENYFRGVRKVINPLGTPSTTKTGRTIIIEMLNGNRHREKHGYNPLSYPWV